MIAPVEWRPDGLPFSPRFGDIYHSESGALAQTRHVFIGGCGLPQAWRGQAQWRILETGFGLGLNFLATWQAWRADPQRPGLLHFVSVEAFPVTQEDLLRAARAHPELLPLAEALAAQWQGLLPGFHRLAFDQGRVLLTLCVGEVQPMLRAHRPFQADSLFLDGFSPRLNPQMWTPETLKAVARFARPGTRLGTWTYARAVRDALTPLGFVLTRAPGLPPKRDALQGVFAPNWTRRPSPAVQQVLDEEAGPIARCAVVGAGLAGAAVAASLARRGWQVTVLDAAARPAAAASGTPAAVLAPHVSPDDALLSRLTRAGARATWQEVRRLLVQGQDWQAPGVLERRTPQGLRLPPLWQPDGPNRSWVADAATLQAAALPTDTPALRHDEGGWVRPARLVQAWLAQPGIRFEGEAPIARIDWADGLFTLSDAAGRVRARAERVVLAGGASGRALAQGLPLQPVRGQLAWGPHPEEGLAAGVLPAMPLNGDGHLVPWLADDAGRPCWLTGSTFEPGDDSSALRPEGRAHNLARLARLHPPLAAALAPAFAQGRVQDWAGVRCASADRRPLVGPLDAARPGLWVCTALGSRGLSFATLCAELLAARWHGEPLPVPAAWARGVDTARLRDAG
ncbi:FAD-dependent 5-carboxymethylaminomethyl-2-thiouridine(34) oxidoreductase MnmC [Xenophilus arseniciresistens]|uniref:tRNA 5-methylaminomethyl-2-thiouridine biosynthesis bifunctional protein MnmC n=1 Tax=Xenophilus arseniciresistens TaxID=1283306 RepID=A0AAE3SYW4_9BURK|nr:FAD-dependent 5-carboxymethylaminomethyl-2-thiouridine(34) oxidoreductase MnmC [Xenophilus arseniciresistens]MDA7415925.1 FAD-dependent 5-carboxymethylaminomethyl-2-thiouridine(34) oxidoreductase MnmC [Xenophilus arseniciresistens]